MNRIATILLFLLFSTTTGWAQVDSAVIYELIDRAQIVATSNPEEGRKIAWEAYRYAQKNENINHQVDALNAIGLTHFYNGKLDTCRHYFEKALALSQQGNDTLNIAMGLNNVGVVLYEQGQLDLALEKYKQSLMLKRLAGESKESLAMAMNNIGNVYEEIGNYQQALEYYRSGTQLKLQSDDPSGIGTIIGNIGSVYLQLNKLDSAILYLDRSITYLKKEQNLYGLAESRTKISEAFLLIGRVQNSEQEIREAIAIREELEDHIGLSESLLVLGKIQGKKGQNIVAIGYLKRAILEAERSNSLGKRKDVYELLSALYKSEGIADSALRYHELLLAAKDSLMTHETKQSLDLLKAQMELDQVTQQKQAQDQIITQEKEIRSSQNLLITLGIILLGICAIFLFVSIRRSKKLSALNSQLKELSTVARETDNYIIIGDKDDHILWVNESFENLTGYELKEVEGLRPQDFLRGELTDNNEIKKLNNFFKDLQPIEGRILNLRKDGRVIWLSYSVNPILDRNGKLKRTVCVGTDISQQVEWEEEIKASSNSLVKLRKVDNSIVLSRTEDDLIRKTLAGLKNLVPNQTAAIYLSVNFEEESNSTIYFLSESDQAEAIEFQPLPIDLLLNLSSGDANSESIIRELIVKAYPKAKHDAYLIQTVRRKKLPVGLLVFCHSSVFPVKEHTRLLIKEVASALALGVGQKRLQASLENARRKQAMLLEVNRKILDSSSFNEVVISLFQMLTKNYPSCIRSTILLLEPNGKVSAYYPSPEGEDSIEKTVFKRDDIQGFDQIDELRSSYVPNIKTKAELSASDLENIENGTIASLVIPLSADGKAIGSLNIEFSETDPILPSEINFFEEMALSISIAVEKQRNQDQLTEKNKDMSDSIRYAQRIQQAQLTDFNEFYSGVEVSTFFSPKDIVSGDFYWGKEIDDYFIFTLSDCTGHGVPGGFMTILGINLLERITSEDGQTNPAIILDLLHKGTLVALNSIENQLLDGMDLTIGCYHMPSGRLSISSANRYCSLYQESEGVVNHLNPNKISIGDSNLLHFDFEKCEYNMEQGDRLYLYSDGVTDQFGGGGPRSKKFSRRRLYQFIEDNKDLSPDAFTQKIEAVFKAWKGDLGQTDDVSLMVVEFPEPIGIPTPIDYNSAVTSSKKE